MAESKGFTIWFTGMSGSGKSTLAHYIAGRLRAAGMPVEILDGDEVQDRLSAIVPGGEENDALVKRVGWISELLTRNGVVAISTSISAERETREQIRKGIGRFFEVFTDCDVNELISRDPKGLYKKALSGDLPNFIGITEPYEPPQHPEVTVDTGEQSVPESAEAILEALYAQRFLSKDQHQIALFGKAKNATRLIRETTKKAKSAAAEAKAMVDKKRKAAKRRAARKRATTSEEAAETPTPKKRTTTGGAKRKSTGAKRKTTAKKATAKKATKKTATKKTATKKTAKKTTKKATRKTATKKAAKKVTKKASKKPVKKTKAKAKKKARKK